MPPNGKFFQMTFMIVFDENFFAIESEECLIECCSLTSQKKFVQLIRKSFGEEFLA